MSAEKMPIAWWIWDIIYLFFLGGEPSTLEEKINDVGIIHALTQSAGAISLHIPWDIPEDIQVARFSNDRKATETANPRRI